VEGDLPNFHPFIDKPSAFSFISLLPVIDYFVPSTLGLALLLFCRLLWVFVLGLILPHIFN
jgi:hypothetical protein